MVFESCKIDKWFLTGFVGRHTIGNGFLGIGREGFYQAV